MPSEIAVSDLMQKLSILWVHPSRLQGHEDNVGENVLIPIFNALGFDVKNEDEVKRKPRLSHIIISKSGLEPDYGILKYGETKDGSPLFGMVADSKRYKSELTYEMEQKLAGYCGLTGGVIGVLTNGEKIIVIKPIRGVVEWVYLDKIPSKAELHKELAGKIEYKPADITYAKRVVQEINEEIMEEIAEKCHNIIRSRKGLAVPERLYEFSKLIVARIVDERRYKEKLQTELLITAENVKAMKSKRQTIKDYIKNILNSIRAEIGIFKVDESVNLDDDIVEQIIEYLDDYQLWSEKMDVLGHVYEKFLMNTMTGRELGGYFTPRPFVELVVKMVEPSLDKTILDVACGSGGFLISPLMYLKNKHNIQDKETVKRIASNFYGIDVFLDIVKLSQINLWLHGDCHDNVYRADSLDLYNETPIFILNALKNPQENGFDFILTNPPYGAEEGNKLTKERLETINQKWSKEGINLYECAYGSKGIFSLQPQVPFIELSIKLLKKPIRQGEGGKLGIVIDNGILSNIIQEAPTIRNIIKKYCIIEAVIGLPKGSFKAYGSNVIPEILILRRKHESEEQGPIFRAEAKKIGLVPSQSHYVKDSDEDLTRIYDLWMKWKSAPKRDELTIYDNSLPVWSIKSDDYRLDNNFVSPSSIMATRILNKLSESGDYEIKKLEDIIESVVSGISPSDDGGLPVIEGTNIRPNYILPIFVKYGLMEEENDVLLKEADIVIVKDGSPGTVSAISKTLLEEYDQILFSYHLYRIRLKDEYKKHSFFISAFLNSKIGQGLVRKYISGAVSPTIRDQELKNIIVPIPKSDETTYAINEKLETLQRNVISSMNFLEPSKELDEKMNPENNLPYLPINWLPGGKRDKQGYS